jgi:hypothetical protein
MILDRRAGAGLVQRGIDIGLNFGVISGFLDEVDDGEDDDEGGDDEPEDVVGGDAACAFPFEIAQGGSGEEGEDGPEFSQECFQNAVRNRRWEGPESEIGRYRMGYQDPSIRGQVYLGGAGGKGCVASHPGGLKTPHFAGNPAARTGRYMRCLYQSNAPNVGDSRVPGRIPGDFL